MPQYQGLNLSPNIIILSLRLQWDFSIRANEVACMASFTIHKPALMHPYDKRVWLHIAQFLHQASNADRTK